MTERWVSTKKHFCDVCKCWISGHPMNVSNHRMSEGHKAKQERVLRAMHAKERQKKIDERCLQAEIQRMEIAGRSAFIEKDLNKKTTSKPVKTNVGIPETHEDIRTSNRPSLLGNQAGDGVISAESVRIEPRVSTDTEEHKSSNTYLQPIASSWIVSYDPTTNTPFYFNSITRESRTTHPSLNTPMMENAISLTPLFTPKNEEHSQKVISDLLPLVNEMTETFKEHCLSSMRSTSKESEQLHVVQSAQEVVPCHTKNLGSLPKVLADQVLKRIESLDKSKLSDTANNSFLKKEKTVGNPSNASKEVSIEKDANANSSNKSSQCTEKNILKSAPRKFIKSSAYDGFKPGYVFTTASGITGYYADSTLDWMKTTARTVDATESKSYEPIMLHMPTTTCHVHKTEGIGEWQVVSQDNTKFGDCIGDEVPTVSLPPTHIEWEIAKLPEDRTTCGTLKALKHDAQVAVNLNADDLKRVEKITFPTFRNDSLDDKPIVQNHGLINFKKRERKSKLTRIIRSRVTGEN